MSPILLETSSTNPNGTQTKQTIYNPEGFSVGTSWAARILGVPLTTLIRWTKTLPNVQRVAIAGRDRDARVITDKQLLKLAEKNPDLQIEEVGGQCVIISNLNDVETKTILRL